MFESQILNIPNNLKYIKYNISINSIILINRFYNTNSVRNVQNLY